MRNCLTNVRFLFFMSWTWTWTWTLTYAFLSHDGMKYIPASFRTIHQDSSCKISMIPKVSTRIIHRNKTWKKNNVALFSTASEIAGVSTEQDGTSSTAALLAAIWDLIIESEQMGRGEEKTVLFPHYSSKLSNKVFMSRLINHLDTCKDVCDDFGINSVIVPKLNENQIVIGFTVKSYSDISSNNDQDELDETGGYKFQNDEYWNDDFDFEIDPALLYDEDELVEEANREKENALPDDEGVTDDAMIEITKNWVDTMMSNMGICPFTSGPDMAGLPLGKVFYTVDRCNKVEHVYARYWKELVRLEQNNERDLSTTLLLLPEFSLRNVELFENLSITLTQPLEPLQLEDLTQLVFFHPRWTFRDGGANRAGGDSQSANYARRSPWPMINLLRTTQVRAAQKGIPTGLVYTQNEKTLTGIGSKKLEFMLQERNWKDLDGTKVNRREHDALSMAKDMQELATQGKDDAVDKIVKDSIGKGYDENAAVNKADKSQIEGGDLVNVLMEALQKRLYGNGLTGAETSATFMAIDFLFEELQDIQSLK